MPAKHPTWAALCALFVVVFTLPSDAAVMSRDWLEPGDGLLTYDDVNQREWLDLSETILTDFPGSDVDERYMSVIDQLALGGVFEGFKVASRSDVIQFAQSAGIDTSTQNFAANESVARDLIGLLGVTAGSTPLRHASIGYIDEHSPRPGSTLGRVAAFVEAKETVPMSAGVVFSNSSDLLRGGSSNGVMLYRTSIPEPSTAAIAVFAIPVLLSLRMWSS